MPGTETILFNQWWIANVFTWFAVLWHCLLAGALVALLTGAWRPQRRAVALFAAPLVSVSALAWSTGNGFNGLVFSLLAVVAGIVATRLPDEPFPLGRPWAVVLGAGVIAYAWIYPHFLDGPALAYFMAAPLGLLPCPTLALVAGFGLVAEGFGSRTWSLVIGGVSLFYALVGMFFLGVWLDLGLLLAAVALLASAWAPAPVPMRPLRA